MTDRDRDDEIDVDARTTTAASASDHDQRQHDARASPQAVISRWIQRRLAAKVWTPVRPITVLAWSWSPAEGRGSCSHRRHLIVAIAIPVIPRVCRVVRAAALTIRVTALYRCRARGRYSDRASSPPHGAQRGGGRS